METRLHSHTQTQTSVHSVRSLERRFAIDGWMDGWTECVLSRGSDACPSVVGFSCVEAALDVVAVVVVLQDDRTSGACGFAFTSRSSLALSRLARVAGRLAGNCCGESVFASRDAR